MKRMLVAALGVSLLLLSFQNCSKTPASNANASGGYPAAYAAGFPGWGEDPNFLLLSTVEAEAPVATDAAVTAPIVLGYFTGQTTWDAGKQIGFDTLEFTALAKSGGMVILTLLPDGRYRFQVTVSTWGAITGKCITREVGQFALANSNLTLTPAWAETSCQTQTGQSTHGEPLTPRIYQAFQAVMKEVTSVATPRTNDGFVLRGNCPGYLLPDTCLSSSSMELRLQPLAIQ